MGAQARRPASRQTPRKPATGLSKKDAVPNASILTFFKKVEIEQGLFCASSSTLSKSTAEDTISDVDDSYDADDRSGELEPTVKRRKLSSDGKEYNDGANNADLSNGCVLDRLHHEASTPQMSSQNAATDLSTTKSGRTVGGFVFDDDSEDEHVESPGPILPGKPVLKSIPAVPNSETQPNPVAMFEPMERRPDSGPDIESFADSLDETCFRDNFEIPDDFMGEEYREMMYSQGLAGLEGEGAEAFITDGSLQGDLGENCCPICGGSLASTTPDESTIHVNSCLDGNPIPLPSRTKELVTQAPTAVQPTGRAAKAAVPRPGQAIPFSVTDRPTGNAGPSAFSKLMSGNAENSAWAEAAAAENSSRGKPAYLRTCPFYKIMPGFSICVDAFRYGAVEDCNAYFLSHFHSDHYIGLTPNWKHGPIYCSRVTGRLVKAQLRVAAHFVVELEFEEKFDIPGTHGASVTMIPANHCPGSSMFLFEKRIGKGANPRVQRILHCGDFRACHAHVTHNLLKPDLFDSVSGKLRHQKIDICYLDTTYLNPRYNFPPQEDVVRACADVCFDISNNASAWDKLGRGNGTASVSNFFQKPNPNSAIHGASSANCRLLVVCGTYSIGKERICLAIAKKLNTKIYAAPRKLHICKMLDDEELNDRLTSDPLEAQVHMQSLGEIRAETLQQYLNSYKPHFGRIVGFRPSGWNYRPKGSFFAKLATATTQPKVVATSQLLSVAGCSSFRVDDLERQRGSTAEAMCFGVPYSEHSSFRELCMFIMSLRIERVVPTVNVGSENSRKRMKAWLDKWYSDRGKGGTVKPRLRNDVTEEQAIQQWDGKGKDREAWW